MGLKVQANFSQVIARLRVAKAKTPDVQQQAHRAIGVQAVAWAVQDYRTRARGGTDPSGASWRPITRDAIRSRLAKRAPWKSIGDQLRSLSQQDAPLRDELRRRMPKGAGKGAQRAAIARDYAEKDKRLAANRRKRKTLRAKRERLVDKEHAKHEIGVDTGRLIASLTHGERELASIRVPRPKGPPPPKAEFRTTRTSVTVGSNLEYAEHFDRLRPIFPDGFITGDRRRSLEKIVHDLFESHLRKSIEGGRS